MIHHTHPPCPPPLFNDEKQCDVRLNESDQKDTQCEGYTQLYPLLMFGPNDTIIKELFEETLDHIQSGGLYAIPEILILVSKIASRVDAQLLQEFLSLLEHSLFLRQNEESFF